MNIKPTLAEARRIAESGEYSVLPVSCELLSDFITPIETMRILKNVSTHCYMLESAMADDKWGRYTFLGFDPKLEITCIDGEMKAGNLKFKTDNPSDFLRQILAEHKSPRFDYLRPSPADSWDIFPTITSATASRRSGARSRTPRRSRTWI